MSDDFDPFADEPTKPAKTTTRKTAVKKETPVTETTAAEITVTLKGGAGFDAPWTVLRAGSPEEMDALLADELLAGVNEKAWRVAKAYQDSAPAREGGAPAAPARQAAPNSETRSCKHGSMTYKTGISASTGKAWKAFFCPTPQGTPDQCKPEFLR